ncbi:MAG: tetratricopeptide repeat protein [Myxococcota bacterium]|nr:tetratricopeptide repeat protein [Myxococcota bacterium]
MADPDDLYMEALDQFAEEDYVGAVKSFQAVVEQDPDYIDAYHGIARACFEAREEHPELLEAAVEAAEKIVAIDPDDVTAYSTLSQIYVWKGDKDTAEMWGGKARVAGWKQQLKRDKSPGDGGSGGL